MPVDITRLESGIYEVALSGRLMPEDLVVAQAGGAELAESHGDPAHVLLLRVDPRVEMPFDIRQAGQVVGRSQARLIIVIGATLHVRMVAGVLGRLFRVGRVEHARSLDAALPRARRALAE